MQLKIIKHSEQDYPQISSALFDHEKIADLLCSDIIPLVKEVIESPDFSQTQREVFFTFIAEQANGTDEPAQLAKKYLKACQAYVPQKPIKAKLQDIVSVKMIIEELWKTKDVYQLLNKIAQASPSLLRQVGVFQNIFHPEGSCFAHTQLVVSSTVMLLSFLTQAITDHHYEPLLRTACHDVLYGLLTEVRVEFRSSLEQNDRDGVSNAKLLTLAALYHDIAKPDTAKKTIINGAYKIFKINDVYYFDHKFSDHEARGAELFLVEAKRLGLTETQTQFVSELILCHKDITDAVKNARKAGKNGENRLTVLQHKLTTILQAYRQKDIFYEAVLLFIADSLGKTTIRNYQLVFTPDIEELIEAFYMIIRLDRAAR